MPSSPPTTGLIHDLQNPQSTPNPGGQLELRAVEAVGEGLMRSAPDGRNIVAKSELVVEND